MSHIFVTAGVFHAIKSWLNDEASRNMALISVTADVSQDDMFPSKADVFQNMACIFVTADVSQDEIFPLKAVAP
jgi:hypothetical protein